MTATTTLYRPIGAQELALIEAAAWKAFPARLPAHPVFHPVTDETYARQVARDRNATQNHDGLGFVARFAVRSEFMDAYEVKDGAPCREYAVPAEAMQTLNDALEGPIEIIAGYTGVDGRGVDIREYFNR